MAKGNVPLLAFNRGVVSALALARTDVDRIRLSAERMNNWIPKTQGAMRLRPGLGYLGSSLNDTGATWIPFVAQTDDTALLEITDGVMRVWIDDELLAHFQDTGVNTNIFGLSGTDTGQWRHFDTGGTLTSAAGDLIPTMTAATTAGVTITASKQNVSAGRSAWNVGDNNSFTFWQDTGDGNSTLPSWIKFNFGSAKTVGTYTIRAGAFSSTLDNAPRSWLLYGSDADTGAFPGSWTFLDSGGDQIDWSSSERRSFTIGSPAAYRYYGLLVTELNGDTELNISEIEMFPSVTSSVQSVFTAGKLILNAQSRGGIGRVRQTVNTDTGNQGYEHCLAIEVERGPVRIRVGSSVNDDDYIRDTALYTGHHRLAFTPESANFYLTLYSEEPVDRIVSSVAFADTGTMELPAPWAGADIGDLRWQQSADVMFVACDGYQQRRIERRGTGRSWSLVEYQSNDGPFNSARSVDGVQLKVGATFGNTTMTASAPFFKPEHEGALFRLFTESYSWAFPLGYGGAFTDAIRISGVTGSGFTDVNDRSFSYTVSGSWSGSLTAMSSTDDEFDGPYAPTKRDGGDTGSTIEGNGTFARDDRGDNALRNNLIEFFKVGFKPGDWSSGSATVTYAYEGAGANGIVRVTDYLSSTQVNVEILKSPSTTEYTDSWREGQWSDAAGWPTEVTLYEGRLWWHGRARTWGSVSDDYHSFDLDVEGDAAPIIRSLGEGPVDDIVFSTALHRLIIGTAGGIIAFRSTSFDEPLTAENMSAKQTSSQGAARVRAVKAENRAIYVHRATNRLFEMYYDIDSNDYVSRELTILNPDILAAGVVDVDIQRQPDTRIHCVLGDGTVAILTYEPSEELVCWSTVSTDGAVEKVVVLPGVDEDQVYYHVRRDINGVTKRFLEKWAMESETLGGKVTKLADSFTLTTDTGTVLTGLDHLEGEIVSLWRDGKDRGTFVVSGGSITDTGTPLGDTGVVGLAYVADYKSTKLAYAAQGGTALLQPKRVNEIGLILANTHHKGIKYGADTGHLDELPDNLDRGAKTDTGSILTVFDQRSFPFNGTWDTDSRIHLRAASPRPCTVAAAVVQIQTNDKL